MTELEEDKNWGMYLTAYAPIIDERDLSIVGFVGVDYSDDYIKSQQSSFLWILNFSYLGSTLIIALTIYILIVASSQRSSIDDLTKLGNKKALLYTLHQIHQEANKTNRNFVLLLMDIDNFKAINDTYGHPAGDQVLRQFGLLLKQIMPKLKNCFRYGGDEFAILLSPMTLLESIAVQQNILNEFETLEIAGLPGLRLSISIGAAQWKPGITVETLVSLADKALYGNKQNKQSPKG